jgi:hypothetical protein
LTFSSDHHSETGPLFEWAPGFSVVQSSFERFLLLAYESLCHMHHENWKRVSPVLLATLVGAQMGSVFKDSRGSTCQSNDKVTEPIDTRFLLR